MKTIDSQIAYQGYQLTQVHRDGQLAIYQAQKPNHSHPHHWDVVRLRILPPFTAPDDRSYPEREAYPTSEDWGTLAFTAMDLPHAYRLLERLRAA